MEVEGRIMTYEIVSQRNTHNSWEITKIQGLFECVYGFHKVLAPTWHLWFEFEEDDRNETWMYNFTSQLFEVTEMTVTRINLYMTQIKWASSSSIPDTQYIMSQWNSLSFSFPSLHSQRKICKNITLAFIQ